MTVYSKETALYNTDAIGSDIEGAGETATMYITSVTNDGIVVADASKGASNGSITSSTTGWHIGGVLEFIRNGVSRFWIGLKNQNDATPTVRIGKAYVSGASDNESHMELDYHSIQLVNKEGDTYFHVSDLRDSSGYATLTETLYPSNDTNSLTLSLNPRSLTTTSATVNGNTASVSSISGNGVTFSVNIAAGSEVVIVYQTDSSLAKAYTAGSRLNPSNNLGPVSFAEGSRVVASGAYSHAEGSYTTASGNGSHAEGYTTKAKGGSSHAEGTRSTASGICSHAEGYETTASNSHSHAEGYGTTASGNTSHAEGYSSTASGDTSHAEGYFSTASGMYSHAEGGGTTASGTYSHAQNVGTKASSNSQTALGKYNVSDANSTYAVIVGNGTADDARSNAATIGWDGSVGCGPVNYGTCATAAATAAKAASVAGYTSSSGGGFNLVAGVVVRVKFTYANSANAPTLNVNGTGAKAIYLNGAVTSSSNPFMWAAGAMVEFMYDGTGWEMVRRLNQKMSLLWTNSSPTASAGFSAQTVQAALAGYDFALVHSRFNNNSSSSEHWDLAKVGTKSSIGADWGATHASRYATFSTTGVAFEGGSYVTGTSGGSNNIYCIPLEVYGFNF